MQARWAFGCGNIIILIQIVQNATGVNTTDAPLFRLGEILLNYAEAKWELTEFNQDIADLTINKLRDRVHVAHMEVRRLMRLLTRLVMQI